MYSWSKDWPTLSEAFFGKGINPTTDRPYGKIIKVDLADIFLIAV